MKPQPSSNLNYVSQIPLNPPTSDQIQKCLDDNKNLILAIMECKSLGKFTESAQYLEILQQNLTYLTTMADAQSVQISTTPPQASVLKLQQESDHVPKLPPFLPNTSQSHNQSLHQLQQFQSQLGFRSAPNSGMQQFIRPGISSFGGPDIQGSKKAGSSDGS